MTDNVISFAQKLAASNALAAYNEMLIDRIRGVKAQPGTPETDADPCNPNNRNAAIGGDDANRR